MSYIRKFYDSDFQEKDVISHLLIQTKLNDFIRDLDLSKDKTEILESRLYCSNVIFCNLMLVPQNRENVRGIFFFFFFFLFEKKNNLVVCCIVNSLMKCLNCFTLPKCVFFFSAFFFCKMYLNVFELSMLFLLLILNSLQDNSTQTG